MLGDALQVVRPTALHGIRTRRPSMQATTALPSQVPPHCRGGSLHSVAGRHANPAGAAIPQVRIPAAQS